ncbi:FG-GAP-like repeat-containing protein [Opitutus terrae]|uniref:ASPIC/UnbV domain protein n=1 Tax=Opitutus terrae (strain DSM 11246 / JCM 15787 / PB90-1) TaxID=452637 RepID=B1ZWX0_OPITP|nr:FG-GAP-like repeat-containing protein [Opitutus terrae]ACB75081.1 ASPIC/UnbV domain protein [Opitutus terrae PB90-1]
MPRRSSLFGPALRPPGRFLAAGRHGAALAFATVAVFAAEPRSPLAEQPLAARSGPRGATLFVEMPSAHTGVVTENRYADPKMWGARYHEFEIGEIGTGVAIGDYDGDGRPDLFVVSKTESCRLFRNLGEFRFEDVTERAGVADKGAAAGVWKQGATFVDVNNDGRLDLYLCRFDASNRLYVNQGDGTFKEEAAARGLDVRDSSVTGAFADYDRDGRLDVLVQTNLLDANAHIEGQANYLFRNTGDGGFVNVTDHAGISGNGQGHSATWWDYDDDGWPDLYVGNDFLSPDKLYHNRRDGRFDDVIATVVPHVPYSAMGSDLGDLNNDGLVDFMITDMAATTHEKDQRGMADARGRAREEFNETIGVLQYPRNALFLNTGTGHCLEAAWLADLAKTDWTWGPRLEDLDNDGWLDLFVTTGMHREATNVDLLTRQMNAETATERLRVMRESPVLAERNLAYRNRGNLEFETVGAAWGLDQKGVSFGAAFGDLDGDGDLDLVFGNYEKGVTVLRNDSDSGHRVIFELRGTRSNRFGVGAKVEIVTGAGRQVRYLVIARGVLSSSEPVVHFGLGEEVEIKELTVRWPSGAVQRFEHVAADRRYTITEPEEWHGRPAREPSSSADTRVGNPGTVGPALAAGREESKSRAAAGERQPYEHSLFAETSAAHGLAVVSREEPVDEVALQRLLPTRFNRRGPALAVGDVNADGIEDVVIGGTTQTAAQVRLGRSDGTYAVDPGAVLPVDGVNDGPVLLFDAMGDGRPALLVTKGGNSLPAGAAEYQPKLYVQDEPGRFRLAAGALPELSLSVGAAAVADFDRDGRLDVFLGARVLPGLYPLAPQSALLRNRGPATAGFEDATELLAPALRNVGLVTSALWSDVDQDGWPDLLVALEWGRVTCFHNEQGRGFSDWTERAGFAAAGTGWWTSLAAADFNGDGRMDYVAGNVGLNTQYRASAAQPALLFYGDFRRDGGEPQLIEAYYEGDKLYPWRSRRDLGAAIPSVLKRFPRNNAYARATLSEILGEEKLAAADKFMATELRSGVFLSQPDDTWRFTPLPRIAQIAPLQGMVAGDFDGDGQADLYAVQNSYAPIAVVGRFDGGLSQLLRGDGRGGFEPVPPAQSGLVVPGDAKALAVLDLGQDGWPDFLVTRNNASTLVFERQHEPGLRSVRVQLRGPAGNPTAIGARLTAHYRDGHAQSVELQAGSGHASQSLAAAFFGDPTGNPLARISVRWPDGATTQHDVPTGTPVITLDASR